MSEVLNHQDLFFTNKPSGVASHRPSAEHFGFVEWCQQQTKQPLFLCQRLDKDTSGAMVMAKNQEAAKKLTDLFSQRQVQKEYLFVSDKKSQFLKWMVFEEKDKGTHIKECPCHEEGIVSHSMTEIHRIKGEGPFYLYKAFPKTGKTHQIRKHATHSGVPILGDDLYQGQAFVRLMLHCSKLQMFWQQESLSWNSQPSRLFENLDLCQDLQLCRWLVSFERRQCLFPEALQGTESLRLIHSESEDLRMEKVGERYLLGWWKSQAPTAVEKNKIEKLMDLLEISQWLFQWRPGAQNQNSTEVLLQSPNFDSRPWVFTENSVKYWAHLDRGQNFGLFLDQRQRRQWLQQRAEHKKVLNLFAFTCGFSLNAALAGASEVVSVDLFAKYLEWGKENFELNGLKSQAPQFQWRAMDVRDYLKYAKKKQLQFDFIVCDPPSFSRSKKTKKVFRVERDYRELILECMDCLAPQGTLLFSCNYEKWDFRKWQEQLLALANEQGWPEPQASDSQWDYEWQNFEANLKAFFLWKA